MTTNTTPAFTPGMRVVDRWGRAGTVLYAYLDTFTMQWDDAHYLTETYGQDTTLVREA